MTVHGAKGLEAPVVILADATADPAQPRRRRNRRSTCRSRVRSVPVIRPQQGGALPPFEELIADEQARDLEEHWRLLYVAHDPRRASG